jgi:N,N'-diacetyllegionaminate synthase
MNIGSIDLKRQVLVIAEIGNNHEGNFELAKKLVHLAKNCRVHAVKFQTFNPHFYVSPSEGKRLQQLQKFRLTYEQFSELATLAHSLGLVFISTPFDLESARFLRLHVDAFKISSGDNNFYELINEVVSSRKPVILSTGLSNLDSIDRTMRFIQDTSTRHGIALPITILHCVASYPVPPDEINLNSIPFLKNKLKNYNCIMGFSDHTVGIDASILAVAVGARVIEKHFTIDHNYSEFRDHQLSADPTEMKELAQRVQTASIMLGKYEKKLQPCEEKNQIILRRSIVAKNSLRKGKRIKRSDLTWMRPAGNLAPGNEKTILGKKLNRSFSFGDAIALGDIVERV